MFAAGDNSARQNAGGRVARFCVEEQRQTSSKWYQVHYHLHTYIHTYIHTRLGAAMLLAPISVGTVL